MNTFGTIARGIKTPIIRKGDNLVEIVVESLLSAVEKENVELHDKDIVAITEAVVGISQGNYATVDQIAKDVENKFGGKKHIGVVFPAPMSRNRFSLILKGLARGSKKITVLMSYPDDEVGNSLFDEELLYKYNIDPWGKVLTEEEYNKYFGTEVFYQRTASDRVHSADGTNEYSLQSYGIDAYGYLPLGCDQVWSLVGTAGFAFEDVKYKNPEENRGTEHGVGYRLGAGFEYDVDANVSVRALYRYTFTDSLGGLDHINEYSLGVKYAF